MMNAAAELAGSLAFEAEVSAFEAAARDSFFANSRSEDDMMFDAETKQRRGKGWEEL